MKNFTNNFKQFTSRLSARWLIMALMMLVGTSSAWGKTIYFKANGSNNWAADNAVIQISIGSNASWKKMTSLGDGMYSYEANNGATVYFARGASEGSTWNVTGKLTVPSDKNLFTPNGWSGCTGTWSTYTPPTTYTGTIKFKRPSAWNKVPHIHMFYDGNNTLVSNQEMTSEGVDASGNTWYKYDYSITTTFTTATIMFNNGGWGNGQTNEQFKGNLGTDYCLTGGSSADVTSVTCPVYCDPPAAPTLNPNSTTVCSGTSFTLPSGYRWYTVETDGTKLSSNVISAGVTKQTKYYAEAGEDGCVSTSRTAYTVNVDEKPAITLASPSSICTGTEIDLAKDYVTSKTGTVTWYSDANRSQEITNGIVTPINTGTSQTTKTYYAKVTNGVCSAKTDVSLSIKVDPQSAITLKEAPTICQGTIITFANYVNTHTGTVTWHTKSDFSDAAITSAKPSQTTTYYAKAVSGVCDPATAELKVTVNNKPATPTLTPATVSLVYPETATLTAGNTTNGLTYTLYNGETPGESKKSTGGVLTFTVSAAGSYTVRVTNDCGTSTSDVVTITVCTPQTNEFRHANSSYNQLANQPTYYPGDKAYFVSTIDCCLTGTWSNNLQKGEEGWWTGLTGKTPKFSMTLTRAGNFTITNMATNGCTQDKNVLVNLDFTITALSQVTNANGTASGADIALTWKHSANHTKVMVVRYPTAGTETIPAGGQSYSAGNTLGEGTVVYVGTSESYTDKNLPSGESYKYYFYTVNNNYYSDGVVLNMSSCPIPAKPSLSSTAITACNGECTAQGYITINNMNDYKDDTYTFELGNSVVTPDANGKLGINSTAYTQYTVTVTNSCGNPNSAKVEIAINDNTPTIIGAIYTQPGKSNAITLTAANGILADWSVDNGGDLSKTSKSNTTEFSAEANGTYTITADNKGCTDTHVVTVSDAFYVYMRQPKKGETAYNNFYFPTQNPTQGGDLFYKEYASIPPAGGYTDYNTGGVAHDIIFTDCDGYVWYGFKASDKLIDGTNYFTVHAPNKGGNGGYYTHTYLTKPGAMTSDIYYTMNEDASNDSRGWYITKVSAPYSGPVIKATDAEFNQNNFADFAALYVTDCSGKEVTAYQWYKDGEEYASKCEYTTKDGVVTGDAGDAGKTNNIRPNAAGNYTCKVTYKGGSSATSAAFYVNATSGETKADFKSNLPVIMVNTGSNNFPSCPAANETASKNAEKMKKKLSVDVKILFDGNIVYDRKARMAYRGSSSLNFQKKSYAFCPGDANCGDADKGPDYVKTAKLNMLGIGEAADKDWVLYAAAADPSMLRNRMVFETYQAMRPGEWGVKSRYVELIINGEYKGVYVMMDKITQNKNRVNVEWDVKDASKRGFILKFDKTDIPDRSVDYPDGDEKTFLSKYSGKYDITTYDAQVDQAFEIEYPEKEDIQDDGGNWYEVINFIKGKVNEFETALSAGDYATVQQIIDYESWADWFILSEYTKNVDAFRASCVFVYDGNKIKATPLWDQELSFNNQSVHANRHTGDGGNKGCQDATGLLIKHSGVYSDNFAAPFWFTGQLAGGKGTEKLAAKTFTGALLNDQCFVQMVKNRWAAHKEGALSNASLTALITEYEKELTEAVRTREANFWTNNGYSRNTLSCPWGGNSTGYYDDSYTDAKADITNWISDNNASISGTGRRKGLDAVISALEGTGLDISISPASIETTPWVPVVLQVQNETGYEYTLTYTDGSLDQVQDLIIERSGDTYKYHIPRPATWTAGNELEEGKRTDISYGIKATLQVGEGNNQCGSKEELPSATATIVLQDEPNEICQ